MSFTLDVNVLLYASDSSSPFSQAAQTVLDEAAEGPDIAYLFWPTLLAYLRIATHPSIFTSPLPLEDAIANVESLIRLPHIQTPGEHESFWTHLRSVVEDARPRGNLVADAHLVALMRANGVRTIVTHDRDFRRFSGIEVLDPFEG